MLAGIEEQSSIAAGSLRKDVHLPGASLLALLDFIRDELPEWRDRPDRPKEISEASLTSQLCAHLNSAARRSSSWDILQFRTEEPDEEIKGRKIDLVPAPCDTTIWIAGRRHVDFDPLLPIECKRLPTPIEKDRDEREYIFSRYSTTGGIQRYKAGHHGARHTLGGMIGYIQRETSAFWSKRIGEWIDGLVSSGQSGWSAKDHLQLNHDDAAQGVTTLSSSHARQNGLQNMHLRHLWVQMN